MDRIRSEDREKWNTYFLPNKCLNKSYGVFKQRRVNMPELLHYVYIS